MGVAVASERVRGLHTLGGGIFSLCLVLVPWMKKVPWGRRISPIIVVLSLCVVDG